VPTTATTNTAMMAIRIQFIFSLLRFRFTARARNARLVIVRARGLEVVTV
jgi:hypothetical protein